VRKKLRIAILVVCGLLLLIAGGLVLLHRASQQVPSFYRKAMAVAPNVQRECSDEMLRQTTALAGNVQKQGRWQARFTAQQINGWLAVDLVENHPKALPQTVRDPRVAISRDRVTLACRFRRSGFDSVLSLTIEPCLPEPNVLALRICNARAGWLPVPLGSVLDHISKAATKANVQIRWRQVHGDPVVFISIPPARDRRDKVIRVEDLRADEKGLFVSGSTESVGRP